MEEGGSLPLCVHNFKRSRFKVKFSITDFVTSPNIMDPCGLGRGHLKYELTWFWHLLDNNGLEHMKHI